MVDASRVVLPYRFPRASLPLLLCLASSCGAKPTLVERRDAGAKDAGLEQDASLVDASQPLFVTCDKMDVLFVIDNSTSMRQEQENLSENFNGFVSSLRNFRDSAVDFRIGVTTTAFPLSPYLAESPGEAGNLLQSVDMERPWLSHAEANLEAKFRALATVGTGGNWDEQPLRALLSALDGPSANQEDAGFLRDDALLAIVIITDEDDLSMQGGGGQAPSMLIPVEHFVARLDALKGFRGYWAAAVMAGGTAPICSSTFGDALFAARLQAFVEQAGAGVVFSSICEGDLSVGLDAALKTFERVCDLLVE